MARRRVLRMVCMAWNFAFINLRIHYIGPAVEVDYALSFPAKTQCKLQIRGTSSSKNPFRVFIIVFRDVLLGVCRVTSRHRIGECSKWPAIGPEIGGKLWILVELYTLFVVQLIFFGLLDSKKRILFYNISSWELTNLPYQMDFSVSSRWEMFFLEG